MAVYQFVGECHRGQPSSSIKLLITFFIYILHSCLSSDTHTAWDTVNLTLYILHFFRYILHSPTGFSLLCFYKLVLSIFSILFLYSCINKNIFISMSFWDETDFSVYFSVNVSYAYRCRILNLMASVDEKEDPYTLFYFMSLKI